MQEVQKKTHQEIDHYRCIVAQPYYEIGATRTQPNEGWCGWNPSDYPHLWEPVYKKEPLCHLPDEHGRMQAMYEGDTYWYCWCGAGDKWLSGWSTMKFARAPDGEYIYRFATKAAAEAKALELNKVEHQKKCSDFNIPHDILSFKNPTIETIYWGTDHHEDYGEWCYWCLRNGYLIHSMTFKNKIYTLGDIMNFGDRGGSIEKIEWHGNYWHLKFAQMTEILMN